MPKSINIIAQQEKLKKIPNIKVSQSVIEKAKKKFYDLLPNNLEFYKADGMKEMKIITGDFTGDGVEDVVIWSSFQKGGNYVSGSSSAVFYKNKNNDAVNAGGRVSWETGSSPAIYMFTFNKIKNGLMYLTDINYNSGDQTCCPSAKKTVILKYEEVSEDFYGVSSYE